VYPAVALDHRTLQLGGERLGGQASENLRSAWNQFAAGAVDDVELLFDTDRQRLAHPANRTQLRVAPPMNCVTPRLPA
jgi:hypothetical protein